MNKVSIIIPTFNGQEFLKETIDSSLKQTHSNTKVVVIDDCSTDATLEILRTYEGKLDLIINDQNIGLTKTVNKVLHLIESDYFILLGHDDVLPENHVKLLLTEFSTKEIVAVHCNSILINKKGKTGKLVRDDDKQKRERVMFHLSIDNFINSCGMMHRTDVFKRVGGWDESYRNYGEWLYYVKVLRYGIIKYTTKSKSKYRRHDTNITNTFKNKSEKKGLREYKRKCRHEAHKLNDNTIMEILQYFKNELKLFLKGL